MIYLASPYSDPDTNVMQRRYEEVVHVAAKLMETGLHLFCPIAHTHPIACAGALPRGFDYWKSFDEWYISRCNGLVVVMLDGWDRSNGVRLECEIAEQYDVPVLRVEPAHAVRDTLRWVAAGLLKRI